MKGLRVGLILGLGLCLAAPAGAITYKDVQLPDSTNVAGEELRLSGAGLRKKMTADVYVAGLYVVNTQTPAAPNQTRQMRLVMKRDVGGDQISDSIQKGFERNAESEMPKLESRLNTLSKALPELRKGEELLLTSVPGKGTQVFAAGKQVASIPGDDFSEALFEVWLGPNPVDDGLKKDLLGKSAG